MKFFGAGVIGYAASPTIEHKLLGRTVEERVFLNSGQDLLASLFPV